MTSNVTGAVQTWRASTSGYSVRQSAEAMNVLQKENFNLKLKLFLLKFKQDASGLRYEENDFCDDQEFVDLYKENQMLKNELSEKQFLLKDALKVIENLEDENLKIRLKVQSLVDEQEKLKLKATKMPKFPTSNRRKSKLTIPVETLADGISLRTENKELRFKLNSFEMKVLGKREAIKDLSEENKVLRNQFKLKESKLAEKEVEVSRLSKSLEKQCSLNNELSDKHRKLEMEAVDMKRIVTEQTSLMKALNKTIEAKNQYFLKYKAHMDQASSSSSETYIPEELDLSRCDKTLRDTSDYPFHNPLFGNQFERMYR